MKASGVLLAGLLACGGRGEQKVYSATPPKDDGEKVIRYHVDVVEDDSDCGARVPIKRSTEEMVVEWHTDVDVTLYSRGGLYTTDLTLDDDGTYTQDGRAGPCLWGSSVKGRITRRDGEAHVRCIKADCTVLIDSKALRWDLVDAGVADASVP